MDIPDLMIESSNKKRKLDGSQNSSPGAARKHTRVLAACDECRISKTRCDSVRPVCAKCHKKGIPCVYPDKDPFSIFESLGERILAAVERQQKVLDELVTHGTDRGRITSVTKAQDSHASHGQVDLEAISRNDTLKTPITGSDMILSWPIFPQNKPVNTFPAPGYAEKERNVNLFGKKPILSKMLAYDSPESRRILELRDIYMAKIQIKNPIVDACELDEHLTKVLEKGFDWSPSSCLVLLVLSLAAIWGDYPHDDRRTKRASLLSYEDFPSREFVSIAIPEHRMRESLEYFSMAKERMSAAHLDDSLVGVVCFCLFGMWHQYNFEPIPGWKMFRTASMLWEAYYLKHRDGTTERSKQEQSLEQRLYWTCLKSECEIRYELADLPSCTLQKSDFPFSLPTFSTSSNQLIATHSHEEPSEATASHYYYLAEISLRRLLNRARNAVVNLKPEIDPDSVSTVTDTLCKLQFQLEQWLEYLPEVLRFNRPLESLPPPNEPELVKLVRERYVEVRELLCRAHLYLCLHCGDALSPDQARIYGAKASEGLLLSVYRIQTENPFFRHPGSWGACRVRFNHSLCLIAAFRGKLKMTPSAQWVVVPSAWADSVRVVIDRLDVWSEEGGGIRELACLLRWLMEDLS